MILVRVTLTVVLSLSLSGCWFVFIPGSAMDALGDSLSGQEGNVCVRSGAYIGERIKMPDGRLGTIEKIEGESRRCQQPALPQRAVVKFDK